MSRQAFYSVEECKIVVTRMGVGICDEDKLNLEESLGFVKE